MSSQSYLVDVKCKKNEGEREKPSFYFFAYANRHIIIDEEERRVELPMMLIDMVRPPTLSIKPRRS